MDKFLIALPWLNPLSKGPSLGFVPLLFSWVCTAVLLGLYCVGLNLGVKNRWPTSVATAWLAAALLSTVLGLLQYFGATAIFGQWVNHTSVGEAFANLRQRNQFATLTNIGLAALLWWAAQGQAALPLPQWQKSIVRAKPGLWALPGFGGALVVLTAALLLGIGNAASSSRTGLLQLLLLIGMASGWSWCGRADEGRSYERQRQVWHVLLAAALAYAVAALTLPSLVGLDRGASGILARIHNGDSQCGSRLTLWSNVLHLITLKPWLGWGWGELDYAHFITLYSGPRFCDILDNAHNLPLHLAVELGVPFALLFCGVCGWLVLRAKPWRERHPTRQMAWSVLALIGLHSLLEYPLWYGPFQMAAGLSVYMLWRTPAAKGNGAQSAPLLRPEAETAIALQRELNPLTQRFSASAAIVFMAMVAYAAWDYHRISQIYLPPASRAAAYREDTLAKIQGSWLFKNQVRFAELTTTPLSRDNALHTFELAQSLLHFSPEARVVEKLIESAVLLGRNDEVLFYQLRYRAAFPENYVCWTQRQANTAHGALSGPMPEGCESHG